MTITTVTARNTFDGNDVTLGFNTDYQFFDASDLVVTLVVDATGVEAIKALTTDYTVTGGAVANQPATGTVTMIVAPATGETLVVERVQPFTQALIDLLTGGKFPAATIEAGYDRVTLLVQQVLDAIRRSPQVPKTTDPTAVSPIIPVPVVDEILVGKSATEWQGKKIGDITPVSVTVPISIANGGTNAVTDAAARTSLAVPGLATVNTFSAAQKLAHQSEVTRAGNAPEFYLSRTGNHGAAAIVAELAARGEDDAAAVIKYARLLAHADDETAGTEDGRWNLRAMVAGVDTDLWDLTPGISAFGVTGGNKGVGSGNFTTLFRAGVPIGEIFTSAEQTITAAGALTLAHSLSQQPRLIMAHLICKTANIGYAVDNEVFVNPHSTDAASGTASNGISVVPDGTNLNIRFGSSPGSFQLLRKDTGAGAAIINANWKLVIRAWA